MSADLVTQCLRLVEPKCRVIGRQLVMSREHLAMSLSAIVTVGKKRLDDAIGKLPVVLPGWYDLRVIPAGLAALGTAVSEETAVLWAKQVDLLAQRMAEQAVVAF